MNTDNGSAIAQAILDGFDRHYALFREYSREGKKCFETANWKRATQASRERILGYEQRVAETVRAIRERYPEAAERALAPGGYLAVVTFHSVEDRMVKRFLQARSGNTANANRYAPEVAQVTPAFKIEKRKAIGPDADELAENPRSRSAKLRVAIRTDAPAQDIDPADLGIPIKKKKGGR